MRLALNVAKMAQGRFSHGAIEETKYLITIPRVEVRQENSRGVEFPGNEKVSAAIGRHPAMHRQNQTPRCLTCLYGTAHTLQTHWRCKGTGAPPPNRRRQQTPEPMPPLPRTPPTSPGITSDAQRLEIINLPAGYAHSHTSLPCGGSFARDTSAQDSEHDTDFDPDMLPDEASCTG